MCSSDCFASTGTKLPAANHLCHSHTIKAGLKLAGKAAYATIAV